MEFRKYDKIHRLGKDETEGILNGVVTIEEKVDGANLSIWAGEDGIHVGSRNNDLTRNGNAFNGAVEYVRGHNGISSLLVDHPAYTLYGEWLVKHTIDYKATAYRKFYLFDIYDNSIGQYLPSADVHRIGQEYGIEMVPLLATLTNPTEADIQALMGQSAFGDRGEGVVIKRHGWVNQFGDHAYAKVVSESFKEDNGVTFGGNNKFSDTYEEVRIVNKFIDVVRVRKIIDKIQPLVEGRLDMKDIPRIISTVYHDLIQEEGWGIASEKKKIDFSSLARIAAKKIKQVYVDILNDTISVADLKTT